MFEFPRNTKEYIKIAYGDNPPSKTVMDFTEEFYHYRLKVQEVTGMEFVDAIHSDDKEIKNKIKSVNIEELKNIIV